MKPPRTQPKTTPSAEQIRQMLKRDGSAEHAAGVQWFFKEEIKPHTAGTADGLRNTAEEREEEGSGDKLRILCPLPASLGSGWTGEARVPHLKSHT